MEKRKEAAGQEKETILIVDDMEMNRAILCETFKEDLMIMEAENGQEALRYVLDSGHSIAAILLDIVMPVMDGFTFLEKLNELELADTIPVFLITADSSEESMRRGYNLGVMDIIEKPIVPYFVKKRVESVMELFRARRRLSKVVEDQNVQLREQEEEIFKLNKSIIETLSTAIEFRSGESGQHVKRIKVLTGLLLRELRKTGKKQYDLSDEQIEQISMASIMHDVGKIAISDTILNKPGKLTKQEYEIMKTHTIRGCEILEQIPQYRENKMYQYAYDICRHHHERWDGGGYPDQLKGEEISIWAQVVSIADVFDALTNERVYKPAIPVGEALTMIYEGQCGLFNPDLLDSLRNILASLKYYAD